MVHARFLVEHGVGQADVQAGGRQLEVGRDDDLHAVRIEVDRGARLHQVGDAFHRYPKTRVTAHGPAMQAVVEIFLHRRWIENRNAARLEDVFALVRGGGRLGRMVVTGHDQHAAVARGAGHIGMLEHVAATVHAGTFAVPHAEHTVVLCTGEQVDLLRTPYGGRGQVFVHAGVELDVLRFEILARLLRGQVDAAQGRAAVTGDVTGSIQAGSQVALALHHGEADHCLRAGHEGVAGLERVLVVERDIFQQVALPGSQRCVHSVSKNCVFGAMVQCYLCRRRHAPPCEPSACDIPLILHLGRIAQTHALRVCKHV